MLARTDWMIIYSFKSFSISYLNLPTLFTSESNKRLTQPMANMIMSVWMSYDAASEFECKMKMILIDTKMHGVLLSSYA